MFDPDPKELARVAAATAQASALADVPPESEHNKEAGVEYRYAKSLATVLWEAHYKKAAPEWEPCDDLIGVLTQIDNMMTGLYTIEQVVEMFDSVNIGFHTEVGYLHDLTTAEVLALLKEKQEK